MDDITEMTQEAGGLLGDGLCVAAARREYPLLNHFITSYVCFYVYKFIDI